MRTDGAGSGGHPDGTAPGRWERLFADMEAQAAAADQAELAGEVADRTRREVALLGLVDRLGTTVGHRVAVSLPGPDTVTGVLREVGPDWLLLGDADPGEALVPLAAVTAVAGLGPLAAPPGSAGRVGARLDLRYALRRLARDRAPVDVRVSDGSVLHGTCDRVGKDFLELAEHPPGEARRPSAVRRVSAVPLTALVLVRSR